MLNTMKTLFMIAIIYITIAVASPTKEEPTPVTKLQQLDGFFIGGFTVPQANYKTSIGQPGRPRLIIDEYNDISTIGFELTCIVIDEGSSPPSLYKWERDGELLAMTTIPIILEIKGGHYACSAINEAGEGLKGYGYIHVSDSVKEGQCNSFQFECKSGACITKTWVCDNFNDCTDGEDEVECESKYCEDEEFRCNSGQCVYKDEVCDKIDDCVDRSDEANCDDVSTSNW